MSVAEAVTGKVCTKCGQWKELTEFTPSSVGKLGRTTQCKECLKVKAREKRGYSAQYVRPSEPYVEGNTGYLWAKSKGDWVLIEVDADDFDKVKDINWYIGTNGYVSCSKQNADTLFMHRLIMNAKPGEYVDHINHDTINNHKSNLRIVCNSTNNTNRKGLPSTNSSGYLGVSRYGKNGLYRARFTWKGKEYVKHGFATPEEAAHQYDLFVIEHGPPLAKLNFPERHGR